MGLKRWLLQAEIGQREMARRLGYKGNGFVTLVANGKRVIPRKEIPAWADALELAGAERAAFIEEFSKSSLPAWTLEQADDLREDLGHLRHLVGGFGGKDDAAAEKVAAAAYSKLDDEKRLALYLMTRRANIRLGRKLPKNDKELRRALGADLFDVK